jgi:hypothetical protein
LLVDRVEPIRRRDVKLLLLAASAAAFAIPAAAQPAQQPEAKPAQEQARPARAAAADLVAGAQVIGEDGQPVGRIESRDDGGAVVTTGRARARLNLDAFYKDHRGLLIGYSRSEFETLAGGRGGPEKPDE